MTTLVEVALEDLEQEEKIKIIKNALHGSISLDEIEQFISPDTIDYVTSIVSNLWQQDQYNGRERDLIQIINSTLKGSYTEIATYILLSRAGLNPEWNVILNPRTTPRSQFNYDLTCLGLKLEIKSQPFGKKFFSYQVTNSTGEYKKIKNFRENWKDYDLLIAVRTDHTSASINSTFSPWLLIDHRAMDPELDLFTKSTEYDYWFLKMTKCENQRLLSYV